MWKALMEVWYRVWGQKRENGCGCGDFENVDDCPCPPKKPKKRKRKMTGVCSAHMYGEDPKCPTCYPETFIVKEKPKRKARVKKVK